VTQYKRIAIDTSKSVFTIHCIDGQDRPVLRTNLRRGQLPRLVPPQYVKPYVKRGKNDRNDAEAICEAAGRPGMHFVPVKSLTQQAQCMVLKVRDTLIGQRTALGNTVSGHAADIGIVIGKGISTIGPLLSAIEQEAPLRRTPKRCSPCWAGRSKRSPPGSKKSMPN
jgi:transposase